MIERMFIHFRFHFPRTDMSTYHRYYRLRADKLKHTSINCFPAIYRITSL